MRRVTNWLRAHALTVLVALLLFFAAGQITETVRQVPRNSADIATVCDKVNAVRVYVDSLVQRTTTNADRPPAQVSDPAVQKLIDDGRKANEEFKRFAREQSKKARCVVK